MTRYARQERAALCDLLVEVGPDAPTLCAGWRTRDLAAHLVLRERRPDAAPGILLPPLAGRTARVQRSLAARPFPDLVRTLRRPPAVLAPFDEALNTLEFFVHHEDVRRARPQWEPRELPDGLSHALWGQVRRMARLALRRFPATVALTAPAFGEVRAGAGGEEVLVDGAPGELAIFVSGRQAAARVELSGSPELSGQLNEARLGV
jgi:uncharacterized protein (TIGR03085 family)